MHRFHLGAYMLGFILAFFWPTLIQRHIDTVQAFREVDQIFRDSINTLAYGGTPWEWIDNIKALGHEVDKQWIAEYEAKRHRPHSRG